MLGSPGVGKTSLVRRFVHQVFEHDYHSTLGVKVDRKNVVVGDRTANLLLWDVHGETDGIVVTPSYLQGAHAAILVFDATRPETIPKALELGERVQAQSPEVDLHLVANKTDQQVNWTEVAEHLTTPPPATMVSTSALSGEGVDAVFLAIATNALAN